MPSAEKQKIESKDNYKKSLSTSVREGCAHSVMVACGEAYVVAYIIFLGGSSFIIGLVSSLPLLVGAFAQMGGVVLLDLISKRRLLVAIPAFIQALLWLPLAAIPWFFPNHALALTVLMVVVLHGLVNLILPAWNSWMGDLVNPKERGSYFGHRNRWITFFQLVAMIGAGFVLYYSEKQDQRLLGFTVLFFIAFISRFVSSICFTKMEEPPFVHLEEKERFSFLDFLKLAPSNNFGKFTFFLALMYFSQFLAAPFFALHMLRDLHFNYLQFMVATTINILVQALTFYNWGKLGDKLGNFSILRLCGFLVPFLPMLWLISPRFEMVLLYQSISGVIWGGFAMSAANYFFDCVTPAKRARCAAYHTIMVNIGVCLGAFLGGILEPHFPTKFELFGISVDVGYNLYFLFVLSGVLRLLVALVYLPQIREVRPISPVSPFKTMLHFVDLESFQVMELPILRSFRKPKD